ncbi:MAG: exo-alpha-sialidase [Gemmatimonadaceae bacterium]|nr:exo-alpha-sialidase [Gemmatimonadaceae bacterium]
MARRGGRGKEARAVAHWAIIALMSGSGCTRSAPESRAPAEQPAREVAPGVVSTGHQFMVSIAPDGGTLLTVERRFPVAGGPPTLVILESRRGPDGTWQRPDTATFSGRWRDIDPAFAPDGRRVWFNSVRPAPGRDSTRADFDIWYVDRAANGWGEPQRLPAPINTTSGEFFATVTRSGTLYFTVAQTVPVRKSWIVRSRPLAGGGWAAPETLTVVNEPPETASNPFIAPDESWLVFLAERPDGFGDSDLYVSERRGRSWSPPRNLGPRVNTALAEFAPSVSTDGRMLYFTRMRRGPGGNPVEERLYEVAFDQR